VNVTWKNIKRLIGKDIEHENIKSILVDLGIEISKEDQAGMALLVPTFKTDVQREADVIEEILRIYGYDQIEMPGRLRSSLSFAIKPDPEALRNLVSNMLSNRGFLEIMNNSLTRSKYSEDSPWLDTAQDVRLLNPLSSDLNVMRQSLLFGGLETILYNINRKNPDLKLYEFGRTYKFNREPAGPGQPLPNYREHERLAIWMTGRRMPENWRSGTDGTDFFDLKEAVMTILTRLGFNPGEISQKTVGNDICPEGMSLLLRGKEVANIGLISKKILKSFDIKQEVSYADLDWELILLLLKGQKVDYRELPKFPEVRRDLALVLDKAITYDELRQAAFQAERHLLRSVNLFDIYQGEKIGEGKKSYAISFILRDDEKTLTDQVIDKIMEKILRTLQEKFHATIR
jgi:phenylalanyl-tRNA synthetase beta chain